jgi:hypothetical protein
MPVATPAGRCDKCQGTVRIERCVDLNSGLAISIFVCFNCGKRKPADKEPHPITAD